MKKLLLTSLLLSFSLLLTFGQAPTIHPIPGNTTWCPGQITSYEVRTTGAQQTGCTYKWAVTNGSIHNNIDYNQTVNITWDDTPNIGTLKVTLTNCAEATNTSKTESYVIRSLSGQTPQNFRLIQGPIPICNTNQVALFVDYMYVPNTGGTTGVTLREVDGYEWEKPAGWNGSSSSNQLVLTPSNGCVDGVVRVRGYIDCGQRRYSNWSQPITLRAPQSFGVTAPGGASSYKSLCGNTSAVTFTATPISCATSYTWTFPSGWRSGSAVSPVTTSTNTIDLTPLATPANKDLIRGTLTANANLGACTRQASLQLDYDDPPLSTPQFIYDVNPALLLCSNSSMPVSVSPVPQAASYSWYSVPKNPIYTSYDVLLNSTVASEISPLTTNDPTVTVSAPTLEGIDRFGFDLIVKANRTGGCKGSLRTGMEGWVGPPLQAHYRPLYVNTSGYMWENPVTLAPQALYTFNMDPVPGAISYEWELPEGFSWMSNLPTYSTTAMIWTAQSEGTYILKCYPIGVCGSMGTGYQSLYIIIGCDEPPCQVPHPNVVYPNPADESLSVSGSESEPAELKLYNNKQELVYSSKQKGEINIPVNNLPEGNYYLHIINKEGITRRQVHIKH